jgi:hypothetical protein
MISYSDAVERATWSFRPCLPAWSCICLFHLALPSRFFSACTVALQICCPRLAKELTNCTYDGFDSGWLLLLLSSLLLSSPTLIGVAVLVACDEGLAETPVD